MVAITAKSIIGIGSKAAELIHTSTSHNLDALISYITRAELGKSDIAKSKEDKIKAAKNDLSQGNAIEFKQCCEPNYTHRLSFYTVVSALSMFAGDYASKFQGENGFGHWGNLAAAGVWSGLQGSSDCAAQVKFAALYPGASMIVNYGVGGLMIALNYGAKTALNHVSDALAGYIGVSIPQTAINAGVATVGAAFMTFVMCDHVKPKIFGTVSTLLEKYPLLKAVDQDISKAI